MNSQLALIPARGGSKGVPRKNLRPVGGKPLIAWTIECALACPGIERVVVSTDDAEIAAVVRRWGAETPFLRPRELARDDTTDHPVLVHALDALQEMDGYAPDLVAWLRPTTPLRAVEDVEGSVAKLRSGSYDCLRSVCLVEHHPYWMKLLEDDELRSYEPGRDEASYPRRQLLPPVYRLNGAVDLVRPDAARRTGRMFQGRMAAYVMPHERSIDIDTEGDLALADLLLTRRER